MPKQVRKAAQVTVKLKEAKRASQGRTYECEVIMKLHKSTLSAHQSISMPAAIDEAENNLKNQLKKYKDLHNPSKFRKHLMGRFKEPAIKNITSTATRRTPVTRVQ